MAASYFANGMNAAATFDLFVRHLPERRNFLVACGVEDALDYLELIGFEDEGIAYLRSLGMFPDDFLGYLRGFRFTGEVWAMAEGEVFFGNEPVMRVTGPLIEAQIVETFLLNCVVYQTLVASKAARISIVCGDRTFVDFSPRRDHAADAALKAARASYIGGGCHSNVLGAMITACRQWDDGPLVCALVRPRIDAFRTYARDFPDSAVLLIDTYDTSRGAEGSNSRARSSGRRWPGARVRLDSGDLAELAIGVRRILDEGGCEVVQIFASGDLDDIGSPGCSPMGRRSMRSGWGRSSGRARMSPRWARSTSSSMTCTVRR
jgi:nicotinate phosphoribosyltransferase